MMNNHIHKLHDKKKMINESETDNIQNTFLMSLVNLNNNNDNDDIKSISN